MKKNGLFNRISKIYRPTDPNTKFSTVAEAKDYFLTKEAQELFRYCCEDQYELTEDRNRLHWTVAFGETDNQYPGMVKWSDQWRDGKKELAENNKWYPNFTKIEHNVDHLF